MIKIIVGFIASVFIITLFSIGSVQADTVVTYNSYSLNGAGQPQGPLVIGSCEIHQIIERSNPTVSSLNITAQAYGIGGCENVCKDWQGSRGHLVIKPGFAPQRINIQKNWTHKAYQFFADKVILNQLNGTSAVRIIMIDNICNVDARELTAPEWNCPQLGLDRESATVINNSSSSDIQALYSKSPGFVMCFDENGNDI